MFFITGDTHGNFIRLNEFAIKYEKKLDLQQGKDVMIILGDAGINYYLNKSDLHVKRQLSRLPFDIFAIHGNHEARPETIPTYLEKEWYGGIVYYENAFPNILFAKDGEVYDFPCGKVLVCGGAYSVDKWYRLSRGASWFPDEQPSEKTKDKVEKVVEKYNGNFDYVLTHTAPEKHEPIEWFLPGLDQSTVDKTTELWLNKIYDMIKCKTWYIGHYHGDKTKLDEETGTKIRFMFKDIEEFAL